ncbi:MAG: SLBB domain-containing protein [Blastocatellia bacterium]|nr:SLBB domain-containing protein [Blastocatellia bacterium]
MKTVGIFFALVMILAVNAGKVHSQSDIANGIPTPVAVTRDGSEDRYRIGYNDTLAIQIFRHPELAQTVTVNSNGTINLFRLPRPIVAVCKSERELANAIADEYRKDYLRNPEVNVVATEQRSQAFAVIGAVEKPGNYFINRRIRLLELIAYAGGPSDEAGTRVLVARTGSTTECKMPNSGASEEEEDDITLLDYKLSDILEAKENLVMRPGDIVSVMDADVVYVYGNVNKQGQVTMKTPLTLTQALASAEGLKPATKKDKVRVLRQVAAGKDRVELVFDLREIDRGRVQDPFLEPNDIVAVSEDRTKSILNGIRNSLTQGSSLLFYRIP